jgi:PknH-like extracellular domain/Protein kinase domain
MPAHEVADIVTAIAAALDYAHNQGLLHRDVKPANIMLTNTSEQTDQRILLADFGIARSAEDISGLTTTNMTVGTVAYAAPEQLMGEPLDGRADQYALAGTAYHLLTGAQPFPHSNPAVVISRHLNADPPKLAHTRPDLAGLDPVLAAALAKDPVQRFASCGDFARAFAEQANTHRTGPAAPTTPAPQPPPHLAIQRNESAPLHDSPPGADVHRSRRRWSIPAAVGAAVLLAVPVLTVWRPWEPTRHVSTAPTASPAPSTASTPPPAPALPPPPGLFPASAIDTVLLTPTEINTLLAGPSDPLMQIKQTTHGMLNNANLVTPPACVGLIFTAERTVFASTGFDAMLDESLESPAESISTSSPLQVEQTAVVYPTPEAAQTVLNSSQRQWQTCAAGQVSVGTRGQNGENGKTFTLGRVQLANDILSVPMVANSQESGDRACQQVMAVRANVVVGARACRSPELAPGQFDADISSVRTDAQQLAGAMLDKIPAPPSAAPSPTNPPPSSEPSTSALPAGAQQVLLATPVTPPNWVMTPPTARKSCASTRR